MDLQIWGRAVQHLLQAQVVAVAASASAHHLEPPMLLEVPRVLLVEAEARPPEPPQVPLAKHRPQVPLPTALCLRMFPPARETQARGTTTVTLAQAGETPSTMAVAAAALEHEPGANPGTAQLVIWTLQEVEKAQWRPARRTMAAVAAGRASREAAVVDRTRYLLVEEEETMSLSAVPAQPRDPSEVQLPPDEHPTGTKRTRFPKKRFLETGGNAPPPGERETETPLTRLTSSTILAAVVVVVRGRPKVAVLLALRGTSRSGNERSVARSAESAGGTRSIAPTVTVIESERESETAAIATAIVTVTVTAIDPGTAVAQPVPSPAAPPSRPPLLTPLPPPLLQLRSEKRSARSAVLLVRSDVPVKARRTMRTTLPAAATEVLLLLLLLLVPSLLEVGRRGGRGTRMRWITLRRMRRGVPLVVQVEEEEVGVGGVVDVRGDWEGGCATSTFANIAA